MTESSPLLTHLQIASRACSRQFISSQNNPRCRELTASDLFGSGSGESGSSRYFSKWPISCASASNLQSHVWLVSRFSRQIRRVNNHLTETPLYAEILTRDW